MLLHPARPASVLTRALAGLVLGAGLLVGMPAAAPATGPSSPGAAPPAPGDRSSADDRGVVHEQVLAAFRRQGRGEAATVRVIVSLDVADTTPTPSAVRTARADVIGGLPASSYDVVARFDRIAAVSLEITEAALHALAADPMVTAVNKDHTVRLQMTQALAITNADDVHVSGITGAGTQVAIIDTGVDTDHSGLQDDLVGHACFRTENDCPGGSSSGEDQDGHGTHVAGIVTGPKGAAPDAQFRALKVFTNGDTSDTNILNALNHVIGLNNANPGTVDIVNMSLGGGLFPNQSACDNANAGYVNAFASLNSQGTTVFVATGNSANTAAVSSPGCVTGAVGVGSTGDGVHNYSFGNCVDQGQVDKVSCFSNATPVQGPGELVDLLAPGCDITSTYLGNGTEALCGTSMASPLAAGVAALTLEAAADEGVTLSPLDVENILEATGAPLTDYRIASSPTFPRVDALAAVRFVQVQPDARIKKGATGTLVGNNIYGTATGQTRSAAVERGKKVTFVVSLQNDGEDVDQLDVLGGAGSNAITVTYKTPTENVTNQVTAGTFVTPALAPGATFDLTVVVRVKSTAGATAKISRQVTATSQEDDSKDDFVLFKVSRK